MITMIIGEAANFVAYAFAPAVLVTPLGALSIIVSAVLAQFILNEKLHKLGILGCVLCITGSIIVVIHAPQEQAISSVQEIWSMATQPGSYTLVSSLEMTKLPKTTTLREALFFTLFLLLGAVRPTEKLFSSGIGAVRMHLISIGCFVNYNYSVHLNLRRC
ncbi:hypothetical protein ACJIZ3_008238 [Penstemon smallii]|uniref:Probable magnesium transporter n=1 Tax=Penstemon smallii TaxID=265156 RepID=A0ABD3T9L2_9LAMI